MRYSNVRAGRFLARPNRFVAHVELDGETVVCHVKNTGRCRELLVPGATVYLQESDNPARKTKFDLIAVDKGGAEAGQFVPGLTLLRPETTWGKSRFDFYWELSTQRRGFVEVKGVTLEENGHARFPDAPTERGVKHLEELIACQAEGYEAAVCFVIQMSGMRDFSPNDATHPAFGNALRRAAASGVRVLAMECRVEPDRLWIDRPLPVCLELREREGERA